MSSLVIRSELAERLRQVAKAHDQPVENFLETLLDNARLPKPRVTLADLGKAAKQANLRGGASDLADRSREIIEEEYERRAARWMNEEPNNTDA